MSTNKKYSLVTLFLTRHCTLRCNYCNLPENQFSMDSYQWADIIDILAPDTEFFSLLGGEPTLHSGLPYIIRHLNKIDADYTMVTNSTASFDYYKLLFDSGLKSLGVSIDPDDIREGNPGSKVKSENGENLIKFVRKSTDYAGPIVISSIIGGDLLSVMHILNFADDHDCKVALSLLQKSLNPRNLNSNNPNTPEIESSIKILEYILQNYYSLPLVDPYEWFAAIYHYVLHGKLWHCSMGRTPAVDSNGDVWPCFDFKPEDPLNLLENPNALLDYPLRLKAQSRRCTGCTWNCPYVSELVADGLAENKFI